VLKDLQQLLLDACTQREPGPWLAAQLTRADLALSADERALLQQVSTQVDGLRVTRLLVQKLRLERLLRGDPGAAASFVADQAAFVQRFRRYCELVPPTAVFPSEEAALFRHFASSPPESHVPL
jgi:hypothetical protein